MSYAGGRVNSALELGGIINSLFISALIGTELVAFGVIVSLIDSTCCVVYFVFVSFCVWSGKVCCLCLFFFLCVFLSFFFLIFVCWKVYTRVPVLFFVCLVCDIYEWRYYTTFTSCKFGIFCVLYDIYLYYWSSMQQ